MQYCENGMFHCECINAQRECSLSLMYYQVATVFSTVACGGEISNIDMYCS
jgi:hypothetical protein